MCAVHTRLVMLYKLQRKGFMSRRHLIVHLGYRLLYHAIAPLNMTHYKIYVWIT